MSRVTVTVDPAPAPVQVPEAPAAKRVRKQSAPVKESENE